ncbi:Hemolysin, contains CBS domains [Halopenitus malekzadehii]|uniref:Hemolysin, contains CBS domains n=1 Tax=Halopenitus malekzadehii TaxID=1267564 RepID=A0A1H6IT15_9EURY|nr:hemolysin family protein [Halopenitus malekzadehii]SEH50229.1 Hemolysin, contains CBS domains [Halopenitus malekzadehii]
MNVSAIGAGLVTILVLTAISAFFSSSELAVFSIGRHRIDSLVAAETPGSAALARLRDDPHRFLVTVLVSNNVANIAAAAVATAVLVQVLPPSQAATGATVFTSVFVIIFGEIAPKSYAVTNAERHALRVSGIVVLVQRVLWPVLVVFEAAVGVVNRITGGEAGFETYLSREEIETIVLSGEETGVLESDETAIIRRVLDLDATAVTAVMVPRTDVVSLPVSATLAEAIDTGTREGITRLPVYGENRDDVRGVLDVRDAMTRSEPADTRLDELGDLLADPTFVPETKPLDELLSEMQADGVRLVLVVDEHGAVVGLATMEDVIEEIVGEIVGHGEVDPIRIVDDGVAVVRGRATVTYLNETLGTDLPTTEAFETVAGLVHHHLGRVAAEGDRVELAGVTLEVLSATATRIDRVRVTTHHTESTRATDHGDSGNDSTVS